MRLCVLRFANNQDLTRAFDRILSSPDVDSCVVEWEDCRIRFMAPREGALQLAERVYLDGGLLWCSHHDMDDA
jgi:hypothetical protein